MNLRPAALFLAYTVLSTSSVDAAYPSSLVWSDWVKTNVPLSSFARTAQTMVSPTHPLYDKMSVHALNSFLHTCPYA